MQIGSTLEFLQTERFVGGCQHESINTTARQGWEFHIIGTAFDIVLQNV